ncbi:LysR family transcriptional regulator [Candidatus Uabimicrobium sp. HlEnr_7]|uniref:LysR family transcriptional regulator n=1 Tax=Candidatus Uabimicrobium helgolandensis TaxID=3095367 RepID=UPI003558D0CD
MELSNLNLNLLMCFKVVAEQLSISKASEILFITQPAISSQIKKLEIYLEERLFDRHNRGLLLTPTGELLLQKVQEMHFILENTIEAVQNLQNSVKGPLHLGTYTTISSYLLPKVLADFLDGYPDIRITYSYESTNTILEKVAKYQIDCAVLSDIPNDNRLVIKPFFQDELLFVASTKNKEIPQHIEAKYLQEVRFLSYPLRFDYCYKTVEKKYGKYLEKAFCPIETTSFDTLKQCVLENLGVTFMPKYLITEELRSGKLKRVLIGKEEIPITFFFVTHKNVSKKVQVLQNFIEKAFTV